MIDESLLSSEEVAKYLGVPLATLRRWRYRSTGPRGIRVGKHVRYRRDDVESWLDAHADQPVNSPRAAAERH